MAEPSSSRMVVPSRLEQVVIVLNAMMADVEAQPFGERDVFGIKLAMDEAVSNGIRHGNKLDETKQVVVEWSVTPERFTASVEDEGSGFVPDEVPDPTHDENLTKPCGRGVMLMRHYMDEVSYNERGNRVTLVKRASGQANGG